MSTKRKKWSYKVIDRGTGKVTKTGKVTAKDEFTAQEKALKTEGLNHPWDIMLD